jgi:Uma2 family endonuclease
MQAMSAAVKTNSKPVAEAVQMPLRPLYRFTVEQYHRMIEAGIFTTNARAELLEGWVVGRLPHSPPHDTTVHLAQAQFFGLLPAAWLLRIKSSITLADSEPRPDLVIAAAPGRRYLQSHPRPGEIALVVEVADATLLADRTDKVRIYARARIPVYWIVNLVDGRVEVYTQPRAGKSPTYRQRHDYGPDARVPLVLAGRQTGRIAVQEMLP